MSRGFCVDFLRYNESCASYAPDRPAIYLYVLDNPIIA